MKLRETLTFDFTAEYSSEAALIIEHRPPQEIAALFQSLPLKTASGLSGLMSPSAVARACEECEVPLTARIISHLTVAAALPVLRRMDPDYRENLLAELPAQHSASLREVLAYAAGTAGALMDPSLMAFPADLTAAAALEVAKRDAELIHYNLYVVDRDQHLLGTLNLQELLLSDPDTRLDEIIKQPVLSLDVDADRYSILRHPGWLKVTSLPVVDADGRFVGAIRYRTLRQLEAELKSRRNMSETLTINALSELFGTGMGGFLNSLAAGVSFGTGGQAEPESDTRRER